MSTYQHSSGYITLSFAEYDRIIKKAKLDALTLALSMFGLAIAIIVIAVIVVVNLKV